MYQLIIQSGLNLNVFFLGVWRFFLIYPLLVQRTLNNIISNTVSIIMHFNCMSCIDIVSLL